MRIVVAIDSFKGSLSSLQAGEAVKEAALKADKTAQVLVRPLADGGEGTVDALAAGFGGQKVCARVTGPYSDRVDVEYCIMPNQTAVIEMASVAGLPLVPEEMRNPMHTTTYGVGELIKDAIYRGCRHFIVGIGGSATNDGGAGMLMALGYRLLDTEGEEIPLGAKGLEKLYAISADSVLPELKECTFKVACDVNNPLCGQNGCSVVYGPQKGAAPMEIVQMDGWLKGFADLTTRWNPKADLNYPGAGAAGGLGFAFLAYTNSVLESGIQIIMEEIKLEEAIAQADLVITGEGRLDRQSVMGKAPVGVAKLAKKYGKKVIAFSGCVASGAEICNDHGIDAYFPIIRGVTTLDEALNTENAYQNLTDTAYQVFRLLL